MGTGLRSHTVWRLLLVSCVTVSGCAGARSGPPGSSVEVAVGLGENAACLVCHMAFLYDDISTVHRKAGITCARCHGVSEGHVNDENIGATPPERVFHRAEVDPFCRSCHPSHDVPPAAVVRRYRERALEGAAVTCTDCHGSHRISEAAARFVSEETPEAGNAPEKGAGACEPFAEKSTQKPKEGSHAEDRNAR